MRHVVRDISSSLSLKPDIGVDPRKARSKVLKISRAELLVPLKTCFTDKANTSNKPTSVDFYTPSQYNFLQNTIDVLVAVSLKRPPDGVSYNHISLTPFLAICDLV